MELAFTINAIAQDQIGVMVIDAIANLTRQVDGLISSLHAVEIAHIDHTALDTTPTQLPHEYVHPIVKTETGAICAVQDELCFIQRFLH